MPNLKHQKRITAITETSFQALQEIANSPEGPELGIFPSNNEVGVTFGRNLCYGEYIGEGLPDEVADPISVTLDMYFILRDDGKIELQIAQKGRGRHFKFPFEGLDKDNAWKAIVETLNNCDQHLIQAIHHLVWASYRRQDPDRKHRKKSYIKIMSNLENCFMQFLVWDRYKVINERDIKGVQVTTWAPIETGRNTKSKTDIETEKRHFKMDVFEALEKLEGGGPKTWKKPTQYNVGEIVYSNEFSVDRTRRLIYFLNLYKLKLKELVIEYESRKMTKN